MQESGHVPPTGETQSVGAPAPRRDPLIRWLTITIFVVLILWLAGVVSAFVFGMFNISGAPRTEVEREIDFYSSQVQSGKANSQMFAQYVDALVRAGQFSKAQDALNEGFKTAKTDKSYLYAEQAQLYLSQKQYQATVKSADQAIAAALQELKDYEAANVLANRKKNAGAVLADSYSTAALAKANALLALNDYAGAVTAFGLDLQVSPTDSDVLVARGQAKIKVGDKTGAAADFRAALKYIPDYQPALDGLAQIGASK